MEIPLLGSVDEQSELSRVGETLKKIMEPHLYAYYRSFREFIEVCKIGNGRYGKVYKVEEKNSGEVFAWKRVKFEKGKLIPLDVQQEMAMLKKLKHENVVTFFEVVGGSSVEVIYFLMEFCEQTLEMIMNDMDLSFVQSEAKCILKQLFSALEYIHGQGVIHHDVNPKNILMKDTSVLKLCDFNSSREVSSKLFDPPAGVLWYRAPELLLGSTSYTCAVDIWASGCIFAELLTLQVLFPGKNECDQMTHIIDLLGTPKEQLMPGYKDLPMSKKFAFKIQEYNYIRKRFKDLLNPSGISILRSMLCYGQDSRITAKECLAEKFFEGNPPVCSLGDLKYGIIQKRNRRGPLNEN